MLKLYFCFANYFTLYSRTTQNVNWTSIILQQIIGYSHYTIYWEFIMPYPEHSFYYTYTLIIHQAILPQAPLPWSYHSLLYVICELRIVSRCLLLNRLYTEIITTAVTPVLSYVQLEHYCIQTLLKSYCLFETLILWNEATVNRRTCRSDTLFCAIVPVIKNSIWLLS